MEELAMFLVLLLFIALIAWVIGLIKPSVVLRFLPEGQHTRGKVCKYFGLSSLVLFIAIGFSIPKQEMGPVGLNMSADVDSQGFLSFVLKTQNVPDGTEITFILQDEQGNSMGGSSGILNNGVLQSDKFSFGGKPHYAGKYSVLVSEKTTANQDAKTFEPAEFPFELPESEVTPAALTVAQKKQTLESFKLILDEISEKQQTLKQSVQSYSGDDERSIFIAAWNRDTQKWEKEINSQYDEILGSGMRAPFCSPAAFHTRTAITSIKLLGIGYVSNNYAVQEKHVNEGLQQAKQAIADCNQQL